MKTLDELKIWRKIKIVQLKKAAEDLRKFAWSA